MTGEQGLIYGNVPNNKGLIANLPSDAVVEVPASSTATASS